MSDERQPSLSILVFVIPFESKSITKRLIPFDLAFGSVFTTVTTKSPYIALVINVLEPFTI